jgi:hypothetical protein
MDLVQKEHERLWKRVKSSKTINDVQKTIDLLQAARDTIAAGIVVSIYAGWWNSTMTYILLIFCVPARSVKSAYYLSKASEPCENLVRCHK